MLENDKKMTNFLVKNEKKKNEENVPKNAKKHHECQVENKLVSKHNKYETLTCFSWRKTC